MEGIVVIGTVAALLTAAAMGCAGINPVEFVRKTFVPMSRREFWLPPCPLCWGARAAVLAFAVMVVNNGVLA